jgi:hypothetical protein
MRHAVLIATLTAAALGVLLILVQGMQARPAYSSEVP